MTVRRVMPDPAWARKPAARAAGVAVLLGVLGPLIVHYTRPRVRGRDHLGGVQPPVIFAATHASHLDTPIILRALPARWRRRTAVLAAADHFYKNRLVAAFVSLTFAGVPVERNGLSGETAERLDNLIGDRWSILLFPEGTRSRTGSMGELKTGAAYLAMKHSIPIVPIALAGTHDAMPPGRPWPRHHNVAMRIGAPVYPGDSKDPGDLTDRLREDLAALAEVAVADRDGD